MELSALTGWTAAGISIALGVALIYVIMRFSAWSPGGGSPVASARTHGMVTALIALFATGTSGLAGLVLLERSDGLALGEVTVDGPATESSATVLQPLSLSPSDALWTVAGPAFWLVVVYAVAQYTWPRPAGQVRTAALARRDAVQYLPWGLTWTVAALLLAAGAVVALAWTTPGSPAVLLQQFQGSSGYNYSFSERVHSGYRPGSEFAPWFLLGLAVLVLATVLVLRVIARRPPLAGLGTSDDHATRRIATNRVLRTAAVVAIGFLVHAGQSWALGVQEAALRRAHPNLDSWADGEVDLYSGDWTVGVPDAARWMDSLVPLLGIALALLMLAWRSPAVAELGSDWSELDGRTARSAHTGPALPGSVEAVQRLRSHNRWLALVMGGALAVTIVLSPLTPALQALSWERPWMSLVWASLPFVVAMLLMLRGEVRVRRGHAHRTSAEHPALTGSAPRWRRIVLGIAVVAAILLVVLGLINPLRQSAAAVALLMITGTLLALTVLCARAALRRPALDRAGTAWDGHLRTEGADRFLGVGTAGIFAVTAAALPSLAPLGDPSVDTAGGTTLILCCALVLAAALSIFWPGPTPPRSTAEASSSTDPIPADRPPAGHPTLVQDTRP